MIENRTKVVNSAELAPQHTYPRALGNFLFATMGIEHLTVSERRLALCQEQRKRRYTAVYLPFIR